MNKFKAEAIDPHTESEKTPVPHAGETASRTDVIDKSETVGASSSSVQSTTSTTLAFQSRLGSRRLGSTGHGASHTNAPSNARVTAIPPSEFRKRQRQSSLSSQLSNVTTFASDEDDEQRSDATLDILSAYDDAFATDIPSVEGRTRRHVDVPAGVSGPEGEEHAFAPSPVQSTSLSASPSPFPARRVSTTPLFPSPLANALSAQVDDIEPLEMGDSAHEADDEEEGDADIVKALPSADLLAGRVMAPIGSPLRRFVPLVPLHEGGPKRSKSARRPSVDPANFSFSTSAPAPATEDTMLHRRPSAPPSPTSVRTRSSSADHLTGSPESRRHSTASNQSAILPSSRSVVGGHAQIGWPASSPRAGSKGSSSPTSSRRSSLSVISGSPSSPRNSSSPFLFGQSLSTAGSQAPPRESIKLQRVPSEVRIAQALHQPSSATASANHAAPVGPLSIDRAPLVSPAPTPTGEETLSSGSESLTPALHDRSMLKSFSSSSPSQHTTTAPSSSAFSPLLTLAPVLPVQDFSSRQRSRTVADPRDVFSTEHDTSGNGGSSVHHQVNDDVKAGRAGFGISPLSRGISPLALAGTGGRAFSVHADQMPPLSVYATPSSRRSQIRRSLAPTTPFSNADDMTSTDEYARIIMQSRSAKMQKWRADNWTEKQSITLSQARSTDVAADVNALDRSLSAGAFDSATEDTSMWRPEGQTSGAKDIEWVDWLEEYRRMKEAKLHADRLDNRSTLREQVHSEHLLASMDRLSDHATNILRTPIEQHADPFKDISEKLAVTHLSETEEQFALHGEPLELQISDSTRPSSTELLSTSQSRRRRNLGGFSHIDAWWSAVRNSFATHPDDSSENRTPMPPPLRPHTHALALSNSRRPGLRHRVSREEMPPPPVPLRASLPASETKPLADDLDAERRPPGPRYSGALAPAATIDTRSQRVSDNKTTSDRPLPLSSASFPASDRSLLGESRRRNPHLSLRLDRTITFEPSNAARSSSSAAEPEGTPALTPGHSPAWAKTPSILPVSHARDTSAILPTSQASNPPHNHPSSTFSMPVIRQHIRHRLKFAKDSCDRELKKIAAGITSHVEQEMRLERLLNTEDNAHPGDSVSHQRWPSEHSPWSSALVSDAETGGESDAHGAEEADFHPIRRSPLLFTTSTDYGVAPPALPLQRRPSALSTSRGRPRTSEIGRSPRRASVATKRLSGRMPSANELAAALGKPSGDEPTTGVPPSSAASSRSTSRSRSPLPGVTSVRLPYVSKQIEPQSKTNRTSGMSTPSEESYMATLQAITAITTEVLDTSVSALTAEPGRCIELVQRVQGIGKSWDDHPDWPCRGWFVQLLLAIAGLSRVVEWWEAEKGFWKFDDDENDEQDLVFVANTAAPTNEDPHNNTSFNRSSYESRPASDAQQGSSDGPPLGSSTKHDERTSQAGKDPITLLSAVEEGINFADDLQAAVEKSKSATILMELDLDEQRFEHLSPVWVDVTGLSPEDCIEQCVSDLLLPCDSLVFAEATRQLLADDSHTVEVTFRLRTIDSGTEEDHTLFAPDPQPAKYRTMEGKGMLMRSRDNGQPTHTMWVLRPRDGTPLLEDAEWPDVDTAVELAMLSHAAAVGSLRTEPLLCRICERDVSAWFFEKHCEMCTETHRLEKQLHESDEHITQLKTTARRLLSVVDKSGPQSPLEYCGISLLSSPVSSTPSPPHTPDGCRRTLSPRPRHIIIRRLQIRFLEEIVDIIQSVLSIKAPALPDSVDLVTLQPRRMLSPGSELNVGKARRWSPSSIEDPALSRLADDVVRSITDKLAALDRLQNALLYADQIRMEWQEVVDLAQPSEAVPLGNERLEEQASPSSGTGGHTITPALALAGLGLGASTTSQDVDFLAPNAGTTLLGPAVAPRLRQPFSHPHASDRRLHEAHTSPVSRTIEPLSAGESEGISDARTVPLSPRLSGQLPSQRAKPASIKDFEIIKPISKGAFGSVYLAKKKATGDYYAVKVLKKADMIAKNQVTNVKAERMILMTQADSDFVVKLFYTFQSRDYLYLVMEYLNGGDCAALVKALGCLQEDWARSYAAEVVLGLEHLHEKGVVHRDLKPDNLLIDSKGHLKLTDFGLSKIGLLGRQARVPAMSATGPQAAESTLTESRATSPSPDILQQTRQSYFSALGAGSDGVATSGSSASGSLQGIFSPMASPFASAAGGKQVSRPSVVRSRHGAETKHKHVVGSPDYIAPESILGFGTGAGVDWVRFISSKASAQALSIALTQWALGVICYEFLYGAPPFHAETPERVFENILSRRITWDVPQVDISDDARDFIERLLCLDPNKRLGSAGAYEVRAHPFLALIDWQRIRADEAAFVPLTTDPESTDYFDPRGAAHLTFEDQDLGGLDPQLGGQSLRAPSAESVPPTMTTDAAHRRERSSSAPSDTSSSSSREDFGTFDYKNLEVLKQANDDTIRKLRNDRNDTLSGMEASLDKSQATSPFSARLSFGAIHGQGTAQKDHYLSGAPNGSFLSTSSSAPARHMNFEGNFRTAHERRPSETPISLRMHPRSSIAYAESSHHARRNSLPTRIRTSSFSNSTSPSFSTGETHTILPVSSQYDSDTPASSVGSPAARTTLPLQAATPVNTGNFPTIDVLVAEDNPISSKVIEVLLTRLGCRVVIVHDGEEAIRSTMGSLRFDVIFLDIAMPILDGEDTARMIRSTQNVNQNTPIVAVTSYESDQLSEAGTMFSAVMSKPVTRTACSHVLQRLGFSLAKQHSTASGTQGNAFVT